MANPLDAILKIFFDNIFIFVALGVLLYVFFMYFKVKSKSIAKPINRSEIERLQFIERMKHNVSNTYKYFYKGDTFIGKVVAYREYVRNPSNIVLADMVIKPKWIWKFSNPFGKSQAFQVYLGKLKNVEKKEPVFQTGQVIKMAQIGDMNLTIPIIHMEDNEFSRTKVEMDGNTIKVPELVSFDYYFGIYYDMTIPEEHMKNIKEDNLLRTDLNELASIYYCKSQEESTFDPIRAHETAMKQKEIELELAKSKGKAETI